MQIWLLQEAGHRLKCRRHGLQYILFHLMAFLSCMTQLLDANATGIAGLSRAAYTGNRCPVIVGPRY